MKIDSPLEKKAASTIERYRMLEKGDRVVASVSGGPDSVAMLLFLAGNKQKMRLDVHVFSLDHMLRGEQSAADSRFVEELSKDLGLPVRLDSADVPSILEGSRRSPEDVARGVRLERLMSYASEVGADRVALGHTADDQVETFLMRVTQGAGMTGLSGIPPVSGIVVRPLIEVWRAEVEQYCEKAGVKPRLDESNLDERYLRNHVRMRVVPFLVQEFGEGIKDVILHGAESLAIDREFLDENVDEEFRRIARIEGGEVRLDKGALLGLHPAIQRGVLRDAWSHLIPGVSSLSWRHIIDVIEKVAGGHSGARLDLPHSVLVEREYDDIVFRASVGMGTVEAVTLAQPGSVRLPGSQTRLTATEVGIDEVRFDENPNVEFVRPDISFPLVVRPPKPGDRFHPLGSPGMRKLSDFFIDMKIPRRQRTACMLVISGGEVAWLAGYRLDERFRLRHGDKKAIKLHIHKEDEYNDSAASRLEA